MAPPKTMPTTNTAWMPWQLARRSMAAAAAVSAAKFASSTITVTIPVRKRYRLYLTRRKPKGLLPPRAAQSEGITDEPPDISDSPSRSQLELLEQLTSTTPIGAGGYESDDSSGTKTIRKKLMETFGDSEGEFVIPLGKRLKASMKSLTVSQRRNIKRQAYLNEVSQRNDSAFFATIGASVILPPLIILAIAVGTGLKKM